MSCRALRVIALTLFALFVVSSTFAQTDPFALTKPLVSQAVASCADLTMSDGIVDSSPTNGSGDLLANGAIKVSGGTVNGSVLAGPGKTVTLSGSAVVTGSRGTGTSTFTCAQVDLANLATTLQTANSNAQIPLSAQKKNPLSSTGDFTLSGGDSLALPAGTYFFHKFTMSGGSTITLLGPVRILATSDVSISGGSVAGTDPWQLRFWASSSKWTLSSSTLVGFVYAPDAATTISSAHLTGGLWGGAVTISGSSHVTRQLDTTPPNVMITSPLNGETVADPTRVAVTGTATDAETTITLQVNGSDVTVAPDGSFETTVSLQGTTIKAVATDAAGNTGNATITVVELTGLSIVPAMLTIDYHGTGQLAAMATYSDGSTRDVTASATWTSSAPGIVGVAGGTVSGNSTGQATITATFGRQTATAIVTVAPVLQSLTVIPAAATINAGTTQAFTATANYSDGTTASVTTTAVWTSGNTAIATVNASGVASGVNSGATTITATFGGLTRGATLTVINPEPVPPDPSTLAPNLNPTVVSSMSDEVSFLYSGSNPIQTGVAPGTITDQRVTVVRGRVLALDGSPLPGAKITALNHPEYGQTISRADGAYDFAFNGGGGIILRYTKSGYIQAQRRLTTLWNEQKTIDDVALVGYDPQVTTITMSAAAAQVARGSVVNDVDGTRRATVIFPAGTTASLQMPDGSLQSVSSLSVRATEFTVGSNGPKAMPAMLPPMSGYTYCVELSADEATAAGASSVVFSQPVAFYVENFLSFPVGTIVPSGYYDRVKSAWLASDNGVVVKILSITNGAADLDTNGDGVADDATTLANLGVDSAELQKLATLYAPGQSLWRVPMKHFTPIDHNWPFGLPSDATPPQQPQPTWIPPCNCPWETSGSIIDVNNQTLGEAIPISGTPFSLLYNSGRVANRMHNKLDLRATGATIPGSLRRIDVSITIAGQSLKMSLPAQANLIQSFVWDGRNAYGQTVQGLRSASVKLSYVYNFSYSQPASGQQSFGAAGTTPLNITRSSSEISLDQSWSIPLGQMDLQQTGFGGWMLDVQKFYDGRGHALYDGTTTRYSDPQNIGTASLQTIAGNGSCCYNGDGGPATSAQMLFPISVASASDGTVYVCDTWRIRKIDPSGIISNVVGTTNSGFTPDGPITPSTQLSPWDIAVGPDDTLYVNDQGSYRVRRVMNGVMTTVAGNGGYETCVMYEGVPATSVAVGASGITVGPDGTLYIAYGNVYSVTPDGIIHSIAGRCTQGSSSGIPGPAIGAAINAYELAVAPDGSIFILNRYVAPQVARIRPDGTIVAVTAPAGAPSHTLVDGDLASTGSFGDAQSISVAANGTVLVSLRNNRIMAIDANGIVTTLAGTGSYTLNYPNIDTSGILARSANVGYPMDARIAADGSILIADSYGQTIRKTQPVLPVMKPTGLVVPSDDGSQAYVFDQGRHVRTVDTLTNTNAYTFGYDTKGNLTSVTDVDGNVTTIERDAAGVPTAIVAPGGQRTTLGVTNGQLTAISDPAGNSYRFGYNPAGLLGTMTDPRSGLHQFTYDDNGLLQNDADPAGEFTSLTRTLTAQGFSVFTGSAEGRTRKYDLNIGADLVERRVNVGADGLASTRNAFGATTSSTAPDGTTTSSIDAPDPRFGMAVPVSASAKVTLPSGRTATMTSSRTTTLSDPSNPLTLTSLTEKFAINGRTSTMTYQAATRQATATSAAGRTAVMTLTAKGHIASIAPTGLAATSFDYDSIGRVSAIHSGSRTYSFGYDTKNQLTSITDPLQRTVGFSYDNAGRVLTQTLPDQRVIGFSYDENGNVTSVTPPGRPAHNFGFTAVDLESTYTPPSVPNGGATQYGYNKDRQLTLVTRPDGGTIGLRYDTAGRLATLTVPNGAYTYTYDATKGTLNSIGDPDGGSMTYTYDGSLLTAARWSGTVSASVGFGYDNDFRVTSETVNGANAISFTYDADSLLTAAGAMTITRDSQTGFVTGTTLGGVTDSWSFNGFGEPLTYTASYNGTPYLTESYTRDDAGRITTKTETVLGSSSTYVYGYDPAGRLHTVTQDGAVTATYEYDSNSNRLTKTTSTATESGTYDAQDRMLTYNGATYSYSANGELQAKTDSTGTTTYVYDALGNLRKVTLPDGRVIEYVIDAQNRRVGKKVNGVLVQGFVYGDQLRIVAELDGTGAVVSRFIYGSRANVPDYIMKGGTTYRIVSDHLGSPKLVINVLTGAVAESIGYDEFGNVFSDSAPRFQPFGFGGGVYDVDAKFVRFGARDYDAQAGRWKNKDPLLFGGGSANLYAYALNDPVNWNDLDGEKPGDPYRTRDAAAKDALSDICAKSKREDVEYAGSIYRIGKNTYSYTVPAKGGKNYSNPSPAPKGTVEVGTYHTHGADSHGQYRDFEFSDQDKLTIDFAGVTSPGFAGYLVTPNGIIHRYIGDPKEFLQGELNNHLAKCSCRE